MFLRLGILLCLLLSAGAPWLHGAGAEPPPIWRPVQTDLPIDPLLQDGVLPNGVRYLILSNPEPKDQVSLRLVVRAGSLHEDNDEPGLAHFVEHMAFRGTREFPNGKLSEALQRLGIALGPDSTAFTNYDYTIYHLELPNNRPATLRAALHAFRQYVDGVTFDSRLIERERGVILAEMASRDTPDARAGDFNLHLLWPKSLQARRKVIGQADAIRRFTAAQFFRFYDTWYRPERVGLICVGAIDPTQVRKVIAQEFATLDTRAPARPEPEAIPAGWAGPNVGLHLDRGTVGLGISLERPYPAPLVPDTHAERVRNLHRALGFAMLQLRLRKLAQEPGTPLANPHANVNEGLPGWAIATVSAGGRMSEWQQLARELEQQHRRAVTYGFTQAELEDVRAMYATGLEEAVRTAATRPSSWLAQQLVGTLLYGHAFVAPAERQRDLSGPLREATREDCVREFRRAWLPGSPAVFASANAEFTPTREQIASVLNESRNEPVSPPVEVAVPEFAYRDFGPAGRLARDEHLADLDVHLARFANGACLNFKPTAFEADLVEIRVRFGSGRMSQLLSRPGLALMAEIGFTSGGLGRHTQEELDRMLRGRAVRFWFQVHSDACVFTARCARRELDFALRVIAAYLSDPGFRPATAREVQTQLGAVYGSLASSPGGPITLAALRDLFGGDTRLSMPTLEELSGCDVGELQAWLEPQLRSGPIEISIVGDTTWAEVTPAVAATLGALPERAPVRDRSADLPLRVAAAPQGFKVFPISPDLKQIAIAWFWPVEEVATVEEERRCRLLASLLEDRLRRRIREDLGATYGINVGFNRHYGFPNANYYSFYAEIAPERGEQVFNILTREAEDLVRRGPTAEEFERVKLPHQRSMTDDLRTNIYWGLTVLSDAQQRPERIAAARSRTADVAAITRREVAALAKRHLPPARAFKFVTLRATPPPAK